MKGSSSTPIDVLTWEVQLHLPRGSFVCTIFRHWLTAFSSIPSVLRHELCCVWAEMGGSESWMLHGILSHKTRSWHELLICQSNSTAEYFHHPANIPPAILRLIYNMLYIILNAWKCSKKKQIWNRSQISFWKIMSQPKISETSLLSWLSIQG